VISTFRFGDFELDLGRYELRRNGEVVKTEPRVLEVLNFLIENRARVVPKEELLDTIWRDVHVSESALTTAVRDARRVLGDSSGDPRWIRTVYGRGFRFVGEILRVPNAPAPAPPRAMHSSTSAPAISTRKSIAVLPFTDLSPERDQSHFCDGIAEELINTLTRIPELRVISRALAFDFRADDDLRELGVKLGVEHILRGSVRKEGERLRITVHLVDVKNGHHEWSQRYDRDASDSSFALQEEIAEATTRVLLGVLTERQRNAIKSSPVRINAYEFYLKGHSFFGQKTQPALEAAVGMFEVAVQFDPDYALAYAGLADALVDLFALTKDEAQLQRADAVSRRAVELAPQLAETHLARGHVLSVAKRYREAGAELAVALTISPDASEAAQRLKEIELKAEG
jgi:TolB-like protein